MPATSVKTLNGSSNNGIWETHSIDFDGDAAVAITTGLTQVMSAFLTPVAVVGANPISAPGIVEDVVEGKIFVAAQTINIANDSGHDKWLLQLQGY